MKNDEFVHQNRIDVMLKEYESQRAEMFLHIEQQKQIIALILVSVSIAIPVLLGQVNNIDSGLLVGFLYFIALIYTVISMYAASLQLDIDVMGYYIYTYIEPELNQLLTNNEESKRIFQWETFIRKFRTKPHILFGFCIGTIGTTILIMLPGFTSLLIADFLSSESYMSSSALLPVVSSSIKLFGKFVWFMYVGSFLGWIAVIYIYIFDFRMVKK